MRLSVLILQRRPPLTHGRWRVLSRVLWAPPAAPAQVGNNFASMISSTDPLLQGSMSTILSLQAHTNQQPQQTRGLSRHHCPCRVSPTIWPPHRCLRQ